MAKRKTPVEPGSEWILSAEQAAAVDLLATDKTVSETAEALEVPVQTVSEWLNHHPGFQAALNRRRQELWAGMTDALRNLLPRAVEVLKHELEGEARLQAAVHLLKCCGLYNGLLAPQGATEPEDADIAMRRRNFDRMLAALASEPPSCPRER